MSNHGIFRRRTSDHHRLGGPQIFTRVERDPYGDPASAPFNIPLRCEAHDSIGPYTLPMKCIRTDKGWISGTTRTTLHVTITGWRV